MRDNSCKYYATFQGTDGLVHSWSFNSPNSVTNSYKDNYNIYLHSDCDDRTCTERMPPGTLVTCLTCLQSVAGKVAQ